MLLLYNLNRVQFIPVKSLEKSRTNTFSSLYEVRVILVIFNIKRQASIVNVKKERAQLCGELLVRLKDIVYLALTYYSTPNLNEFKLFVNIR